MRERLFRPEAIAYANKDCNNSSFTEHAARTLVTGVLLAWMRPESVVDPACGDGSVEIAMARHFPLSGHAVLLNDLSRTNIMHLSEWGAAEHGWLTANTSAEDLLTRVEPGDVVVLTEILEHLEDPDALLRLARTKANRLIASSPEMRPGQIDNNPEHLWMFDGEGYEQMLIEAGWATKHKTHLTFRSDYNFQIWVCERA